jgi:hypothetical protein
MTKIIPENTKQNNWNFPISYFCFPIVCENSFIQLSCCHYTDKLDNKGCISCGYCFQNSNYTFCGILNKCGNWYYSPLFCYENDDQNSFQQNYCIPFCLISSILIKENVESNGVGRMPKNLYLHSCLGIWCIQKHHINHSYDLCSICIHCECNNGSSPCNYGCGIGPIGFTAGGNCFPLFWNLQYGECNIFYKYFCCIGILHKTPEYDKGCSTGLPICIKRTEIIIDNNKYLEEKGIKYLIPWKVNIMQ